jgi:hypothetical protein
MYSIFNFISKYEKIFNFFLIINFFFITLRELIIGNVTFTTFDFHAETQGNMTNEYVNLLARHEWKSSIPNC